jgi:aspartate/glutamate racemase
MNKSQTTKRILIIGGMGPQASIHAHKRLQELLVQNGKTAEIVHASLSIEPFFDSRPTLNLTDRQIALLSSIDADLSFIACNTTAHLFFDNISSLIKPKLLSMLNFDNHNNPIMVCSPTSKKFRVFGDTANHLDDELDKITGEIIELVIQGNEEEATKKFKKLMNTLPQNQEVLVSCTELSMLAHKLKLNVQCTLEELLHKLVQDL